MHRKRAIAYLDERNDEAINSLLTHGAEYPVGYIPIAIFRDHQKFAYGIVVQGHDLPHTPEGMELPQLQVEFINRRITIKGWNDA